VLPENVILAEPCASSGELARAPAANNGERIRTMGRFVRKVDGFERRARTSASWPTQAQRFKSSSRATVAMMQPADLWNSDHLSFRGMLDSTWHRRVTFQRKMRA
jgi:hypothetical protein